MHEVPGFRALRGRVLHTVAELGAARHTHLLASVADLPELLASDG